MAANTPVRLTVSEIRQRIYEVAGVRSQGAGSLAGRLFHLAAECALDDAHPAGWRSSLTAELNSEEWISILYDSVVGPELTRRHATLVESGEEVFTLWSGVRTFASWFCGLLAEAARKGVIRYDGQEERWLGGEGLFACEYELESVLTNPEWTRPVLIAGRLDQVIRLANDRWCAIELKLGEGHPEADTAQACLYHELLGGGSGSAAVVHFGKMAQAQELVLAGEWIQQERPKILALIGELAGVAMSAPPHSEAAVPMQEQQTGQQPGWPKPPSAVETEIGRKLVRALQEFGADARLVDTPLVGPAFVRYLLEPGRGVSTSKIEKQGSNLQMRLQIEEEPMIGRSGGRIAVDIRRPVREIVPFASIRSAIEGKRNGEGSSCVVAGVDLKGTVHFIDLAKSLSPHLLVGGVTGSGKSEWLRSAIAGLLITNTPSTLRFVLIDPKKTAFADLAGSPFLWRTGALIDSPDSAVYDLLQDLIEEIGRRNELLKQNGADDLASYRHKTGDSLPRIVCVVDEFADLLLAGPKKQRDEFEQGFNRIAQVGRAAGVHLVLATQRPSRQVVSGLLKANLPGKIALKVSNRYDSIVLIDQSGAQNLLGKGDLIFTTGGDPIRLQSPWLSEDERAEIFRSGS